MSTEYGLPIPEPGREAGLKCRLKPIELKLHEFPEAVRDWPEGCPGCGLTDVQRAEILQHWLVWSQGDTYATRRQWLYLNKKKVIPDRDEYVLRLWESIDRPEAKNSGAKPHFESSFAPWEYYARHFFGWFLSRFNLTAARRIFSDHPITAYLHWVFSIICLGATAGSLWFGKGKLELRYSVVALSAAMALVGIVWLYWAYRLKLPTYAFIYSLIPRLGVAVGLGYLFLAGAPHLVRAIAASTWNDPRLYLTALGLVAAAFLYVPFHISRRVYPPLRLKELLVRSVWIVALGIGYASLELLFFAPFFFTGAFLGEGAFKAGPPQLLLCGSIALILGVILQLAWDEKPMTEPL